MTTFTTTRKIPAQPATVFAAIEDPTQLAAWWGPRGFTNSFETFEFKPQGRWVFTMHGPDGASYPTTSVFSAIEPNRKVVVQHQCQPFFELTITLTADGGGTLVRWEQAFADVAVAQAVRAIAEPANEDNLDRLTAVVCG